MYARKFWITLGGTLLLTLGLTACDVDVDVTIDGEGIRGSGNVVTEEMALAGFTAVDLQNAFEADITQAESFSVSIRVDDNILELLDVTKVGDTLRVRLKPGTRLRGDVTLEATITMPDLKGLSLGGAAKASVSGFRATGQLEIDLSGASEVEGDLEAGNISIEASGASRVTLEGSATEATIGGSGASKLELADFALDTAEVRLSGASEATVNVSDRIERVDVSGASRLRYLGDPTLGSVNVSGVSTLEKID